MFCSRNIPKIHLNAISLFSYSQKSYKSCNVNTIIRTFCDASINSTNVTPTKKANKNKQFITLIGSDGNLTTSTLEAALKLSKRRNLQLIKVSDLDARKENPLYKLLTGTQVLKDDLDYKKQSKNKTGFKSQKIISFSNTISAHDLESKVNQIFRWLEKKHEVRATISGSLTNVTGAESIYEQIEAKLKDRGRLLQKITKDNTIKFQILPLKEDKKGAQEES